MSVSSSLSRWSRAALLVATPALALGALVAVPAPSQADAEVAPVALAADWLAGRLVDGRVPDVYYDATVEVGLALLAEGGHRADVESISDFLASEIGVYIVGDGLVSEQFNAGEAARVATFVRAAGGDVSAFGGRDLLADVESHVTTEGRVVSTSNYRRISDNVDQAYGVLALHAADSPYADEATDFLVGLQCAEGFWLDGSGGGSDGYYPPCPESSGAGGQPSVTALAVLSLLPQSGDPDVRAALGRAVDWLLSVQAPDGSFTRQVDPAQTAGATPDVYSTGLAAQALGAMGRVEAAAAAAQWLRGRQVTPDSPCDTEPCDALGSITNNGTVGTVGGAERATSAALRGLLSSPDAVVPRVIAPDSGFVRARSRQHIDVAGLAPGQQVRVTGPSTSKKVTADPDGRATAAMRLPAASGRYDYDVSLGESVLDTVSFDALSATALDATITRDTVRATGSQRVVVGGLAAGESVRVKYRGRFVAHGTARADGRFATTFRVGGFAGERRVRVLGEFRNRNARESFVVTSR